MRYLFAALVGAAAVLAGFGGTIRPALAQGPSAGRLTCTVGSGLAQAVKTQRPIDCRFRPRRGPLQRYSGVIKGFVLDTAAINRAVVSWRVYGPYARAHLGVLEGRYARPASGGAALVGTAGDDVRLEPRAVPYQRGANVALGVTAFELSLARPQRRR